MECSEIKRLRRSGNSITVSVTNIAAILDLEPGDLVQITLKKIEEDEEE